MATGLMKTSAPNNPFDTAGSGPDPSQISDPSNYTPISVPSTPSSWTNQVSSMGNFANRPTSEFTADANANLDKSNLMGPGNSSDPMSDALSAKAGQVYKSQIANMSILSQVGANQRQLGLEANNINNKAAIFSNQQQVAQLRYQQVAFQRQQAIQAAAQTQQLYSQIFGGIATVGGAAAGGAFSASQASPIEPPTGQAFSYDSMGVPMSYNTATSDNYGGFGTIGG